MEEEFRLPTFARDIAVLSRTDQTRMDRMVHTCFLSEAFAMRIWNRYKSSMYDEYLVHLDFLDPAHPEKGIMEVTNEIQNVFPTVLMPIRERQVIREIVAKNEIVHWLHSQLTSVREEIRLAGVNGVSGEPGARGMPGAPGTGLSGAQGMPGAPGTGFSGVQGMPGEDGSDGVSGQPGANGASAADGTGKTGVPGEPDVEGKPGVSGAPGTGFSGVQGMPGEDGSDGMPGQSGENGASVPEGKEKAGISGEPGVKGKSGKDGVSGREVFRRLVEREKELSEMLDVQTRELETYESREIYHFYEKGNPFREEKERIIRIENERLSDFRERFRLSEQILREVLPAGSEYEVSFGYGKSMTFYDIMSQLVFREETAGEEAEGQKSDKAGTDNVEIKTGMRLETLVTRLENRSRELVYQEEHVKGEQEVSRIEAERDEIRGVLSYLLEYMTENKSMTEISDSVEKREFENLDTVTVLKEYLNEERIQRWEMLRTDTKTVIQNIRNHPAMTFYELANQLIFLNNINNNEDIIIGETGAYDARSEMITGISTEEIMTVLDAREKELVRLSKEWESIPVTEGDLSAGAGKEIYEQIHSVIHTEQSEIQMFRDYLKHTETMKVPSSRQDRERSSDGLAVGKVEAVHADSSVLVNLINRRKNTWIRLGSDQRSVVNRVLTYLNRSFNRSDNSSFYETYAPYNTISNEDRIEEYLTETQEYLSSDNNERVYPKLEVHHTMSFDQTDFSNNISYNENIEQLSQTVNNIREYLEEERDRSDEEVRVITKLTETVREQQTTIEAMIEDEEKKERDREESINDAKREAIVGEIFDSDQKLEQMRRGVR